MLRPSERTADTDGVLNSCGDVNGCSRIDLPHRGGDGLRVRALVVRRAAYDGVKRWRQRGDDLVGVLVEGNPDHENPALRTIDRLEACERLPDAIGGMADVDNSQRVLRDKFEAAGPAGLAKARAYGGFDAVGSFSGPRTPQPEQEESNRDRGIVELKRSEQAYFERSKFVSLELEIEPLPCCRE